MGREIYFHRNAVALESLEVAVLVTAQRGTASAHTMDYNTQRPHSSPGNLTPHEFATQTALEIQAA